MFALKNQCEKYLEKEKDLCVPYMDLEKEYIMVDRHAMWRV